MMLCDKPFMVGNLGYGCGQCLPCRINRRRLWTWRQVLESMTHAGSSFITLTYDDDHLPDGGNLERHVVPQFIRALRDTLGGKSIRYLYVGEYGGQTYRPHYHLSLFGLSPLDIHRHQSNLETFAATVTRAWSRGFTYTTEFNELTAQYVAGYVVKKLEDKNDAYLQARVPEFARMSNRPGIGAPAIERIASSIIDSCRSRGRLPTEMDVPHYVKVGSRRVPLGRYLINRLRLAVGFSLDEIGEIKQKATMEQSLEMSVLQSASLNTSAILTPKEIHLKSTLQRRRQVAFRASLFKKVHKL